MARPGFTLEAHQSRARTREGPRSVSTYYSESRASSTVTIEREVTYLIHLFVLVRTDLSIVFAAVASSETDLTHDFSYFYRDTSNRCSQT